MLFGSVAYVGRSSPQDLVGVETDAMFVDLLVGVEAFMTHVIINLRQMFSESIGVISSHFLNKDIYNFFFYCLLYIIFQLI